MKNVETIGIRPQVTDRYYWEPIPEGCLLYEEVSCKLLSLNSSAEAVLSFCDGERTVEEICNELEVEFEIPRSQSLELIQQLSTEGVIVAAAA